MTNNFIRVYFNNGSTTLLYNETTSVQDMVKAVLKGRFSLNDFRYKHCFRIRASKYARPFNANNVSASSACYSALKATPNPENAPSTTNVAVEHVEKYVWLRNDMLISEWLASLVEQANPLDFWKLVSLYF